MCLRQLMGVSNCHQRGLGINKKKYLSVTHNVIRKILCLKGLFSICKPPILITFLGVSWRQHVSSVKLIEREEC